MFTFLMSIFNLLGSFSRETPQRFKKEMVKAIQSNDGTVMVDSLNQILINIGRSDQLLSESEMHQLLVEAGAKSRSIEMSAISLLFTWELFERNTTALQVQG
jgi:hypothetical protein